MEERYRTIGVRDKIVKILIGDAIRSIRSIRPND
jgi:hypothetical protein